MPKIVDHQERRAEISAAAARAIDEQGLDRVRLVDVARRAACTTGAVSHYFPHKEAVLAAALEHVLGELTRLRAHDPSRWPEASGSGRKLFSKGLAEILPLDEPPQTRLAGVDRLLRPGGEHARSSPRSIAISTRRFSRPWRVRSAILAWPRPGARRSTARGGRVRGVRRSGPSGNPRARRVARVSVYDRCSPIQLAPLLRAQRDGRGLRNRLPNPGGIRMSLQTLDPGQQSQ